MRVAVPTVTFKHDPSHPETRESDEGTGIVPGLDVHWQRGF